MAAEMMVSAYEDTCGEMKTTQPLKPKDMAYFIITTGPLYIGNRKKYIISFIEDEEISQMSY